MATDDLDKQWRNTVAAVAAAIGLVALTGILFSPVLETLILAATVSAVVTPLTSRLESWVVPSRLSGRWPRTVLAATATAAVLVLFFGLAAVAVSLVVDNADLLKSFAVQVAALVEQGWERWLGSPPDLEAEAVKRLNQLAGYAQGALAAATGFLANLVIFTAALYLGIRYGQDMVTTLRDTVPAAQRGLFDRFKRSAYSALYAVYVVHLSTAAITVILALPFFHLIGWGDHALFWALLCGLFQLVPVIGPSLIMFSIGGYAIAQGDTTTGIVLIAVGYPVVAAIPDVVFRPLMMGREMKLDPLILILGLFGGTASMGMLGFVVGPMMLKLIVESMTVAAERSREHTAAQASASEQEATG